MDAYDIASKIRHLWAENYDRNSGLLMKGDGGMVVTIDGKKITDVVYKDGHIELKAENEQENI